MSSSDTASPSLPKLRIAICGGGIAGLTLAATLHKYSRPEAQIEVNIYEADPEVRTAGAGITVWPRTWAVMRDLGLNDALSSVAVRSSGTPIEDEAAERRPAFVARKADQPSEGYTYARVLAPDGSTTMHRRDMLNVFLRSLPDSYVLHTSKQLIGYVHGHPRISSSGPAPVMLQFADETTAEADVLIGADGIHSTTRYSIQAWQECPRCKAAQPVWTGVHSYRCLIPTEKLYGINPAHTTKTIGSVLCYSGKGKVQITHIITYQISGGTLLNFVALCREPDGEGTHYVNKWVMEVPREVVLSQFTFWEPEVQQMLECVTNPTRWAIHAVTDLPFAVRGNVALTGDAMHAMSPNFGAGGGQAIEDAYILGRLLADPRVAQNPAHASVALKAFERVRLPFTTDVARRARDVGLMYEFNAPEHFMGSDWQRRPPREDERKQLDALGRVIHDMWAWQWEEGLDEQWEAANRALGAALRQS